VCDIIKLFLKNKNTDNYYLFQGRKKMKQAKHFIRAFALLIALSVLPAVPYQQQYQRG
jgi:hypothetical protein